MSEDYINIYEERPYLNIVEWSVDDIKADVEMLGLSGSPTKVKKIENVVFTKKDSTKLSGNDEDVESLMKDLIDSHVIG
jgi:electron transfer flavoprotein beta subunit